MLLITLVALAAAVLRIFLIWRDSVLFAYDMGRDLLWVKDIVFYQTPTLIGPAASIWGVYFGPLWFYFLTIPLFLTGGHPLSAVYATAAVIVATGALAFFLFKKYLGSINALVLSVLILFNSTLVNISTFAFHANVLPLLTLLMIYFCYLAIIRNAIYMSLAFLSVSVMFHADPAPALVNTFLVIAIIFIRRKTLFIFKIYKSKNFKKTLLASAIFYSLPFTPQILFELRNNLIQTKSLVAYFLGENPSLSGQLPFFQRIINRTDLFFDFFQQTFVPQSNILAAAVLLAAAYGLYMFFKKNKDKNLHILAQINLYFLALFFLIFTFLITVEVKQWYLYGLPVIFSFLITFALISIKSYKFLPLVLLAIFIVANISPFLIAARSISAKGDPALLANQLAAINMIYRDADSQDFSVYIFTPSIYDHHYQYLFWWQGQKLGRGLPQDFAYLPNQPEYVRNKNFYTQTSQQSNRIYLIVENALENEFYTKDQWLANFASFQLVWEKDINNALKLQKRQR